MGLFNSKISSKTVSDFDPTRYIGRWNEVARYESLSYEKMCNSATADYTWHPDKNMLGIRNTCYKDGSMVYASEGLARIPDLNDKSKLLVKFISKPSSPLEAPYWVHWTDYDNYSIVGSPNGMFLWVLSRKEKVPASDIPMLVNLVKSFGYDEKKLMAFPENVEKENVEN